MYERVDFQAKRCRTTRKPGPPWALVVRRVTRDADTGEVLEDLEIQNQREQDMRYELPVKPNGNVARDIVTKLYYKRAMVEV